MPTLLELAERFDTCPVCHRPDTTLYDDGHGPITRTCGRCGYADVIPWYPAEVPYGTR